MILRNLSVVMGVIIFSVCVVNFFGGLPELPFIYGFEYIFYVMFLMVVCMQPSYIKELDSSQKKKIGIALIALFVVLRISWPFTTWTPDIQTAQKQYDQHHISAVVEEQTVEKQSKWNQTVDSFGKAFSDLWDYQQILLIALTNDFKLETPTVELHVEDVVWAKKHIAEVKASVNRINEINDDEVGAIETVNSDSVDNALAQVTIYDDDVVSRQAYNSRLKESYGKAQYEYDYFINANRANLSKYVSIDNKDYFTKYEDTDLVLAALTMQEQVNAPVIHIAKSGLGVVGDFIYNYIAWVMFFATAILSFITAYYIMTVKSEIRVEEE
tara:strand:+ start:1850 stop:2830 length:981 start_codon:yes stop_codon:yes gene_type:complete